MNSKTMRSNLMLLLTAFIWGSSYVAISVGMDYIGPFTFAAIKFYIAGLVLIPIIRLSGHQTAGPAKGKATHRKYNRRYLIKGGITCGICLAIATMLQQTGLLYTTTGKAGFLTAMYILIVPFLGVLIGRNVSSRIWISIIFAVAGLYLLCMSNGLSVNKGDVLELLCGFAYAFHIMSIDHFAAKLDGLQMSCVQFFAAAVICSVTALIFEAPSLSGMTSAWVPLLYSGVLACGTGFTLQIVAQKHSDPVIASLILSLESTFAALTGWVILHEYLSTREIAGCILMFIAIILAQLPEDLLKNNRQN